MKELLKCDHLIRNYYKPTNTEEKQVIEVLKDLSFTIKEQEFVGIMGKSGCGKTTLLKVLGMIEGEFNDMTQNITAEELNKVKEFMVKSQQEALEKNGSWTSAMAQTQLNGVDSFNGAIDELNAVTEQDVKDFMKRLLDQGNYRIVILDPEN